jgi:hypothetical protein
MSDTKPRPNTEIDDELPDLEFDDELPELKFDDPVPAADEAASMPLDLTPIHKTTTVGALLRGTGQGLTAGFSDEGLGLLDRALYSFTEDGRNMLAANKKLKDEGFTGDIGPTTGSEAYTMGRDEERQLNKTASEEHSGMYNTGNVAGSLLGVAGGTAALKGIGATKAAATLNPALGKFKDPKAWAAMAKSMGILGAMEGAGRSEADSLGGVAADTVLGAGTGVVISPVAKVFGHGIDGLAKAGGKSVARYLGRGDVADDYIKNAARVNDKDLTFDNLQQHIDDHGNQIFNAADDAAEVAARDKEAAAAAMAEYKQTTETTDKAVEEIGKMYNQAAASSKGEIAAAEQAIGVGEKATNATIKQAERAKDEAIRAAREQYKRGLKKTAEVVPDEAVALTDDALKAANEQWQELAKKQVELTPKGVKVDMNDVVADLKRQLNERKIAGRVDTADIDAKTIKEMLGRLQQKTKVDGKVQVNVPELTPQEVTLLRQNTKGGAFDANTGAPIPRSDRVVRAFRKSLNAKLDALDPGNPALADARQKLSTQIQRLDDASGAFGGDPDTVRRALARTADPKYKDLAAILDDLGQSTGKDIKGSMRGYYDARRQLSDANTFDEAFAATNPAATERAAIEEARQAGALSKQEAEAALAALRQKNAGLDSLAENNMMEAWENAINRQGDARVSLDEVLGRFKQSGPAADAAKKQVKDLRGVISRGPDGKADSQDVIRRLLFAKSNKPETHLKAAMSKIGEQSGRPKLAEDLDMLRIKERFSAGGPNGSRLSQTGRAAGRLLGKGSKAAADAGALVGGAGDYRSGKIAKKALDAYLATQKVVPTFVHGLTAALVHPTYSKMLDEAASRSGMDGMLATHATLMRTDPEYRKAVEAGNGSTNKMVK